MPRNFRTFLIALTCFISVSAFSLDIPKTLWVYWDSPIESAPLIVQICLQKMRSTCQKESWSLVILNSTNLPNYISTYETELMQIKKRSTHPQWKATFADLVRLNVLQEHGGVWIDISSILFKGLSWIHKLEEIPYLLTNLDIYKGEQPDVILPYITYHQNSAETRDSYGQITNWLPGYQVWFMAAKKNATFMHKWRKMYEKHYQLTESQNAQEENDKNYYLISTPGDYLNCQKSAYEIIQQEQARFDSSLSLFGQRKNANKEFKIVGFHGEFGPSLLFQGLTQNDQDYLDLTLEQFEKKYFLSTDFFLKLTSLDRSHYEEKVWRIKLISEKFNKTQNVFDQYMASKPQKEDCEFVTFIVKGSVFGQLIKNNSIAIKNGVFAITKQQRQQLREYCMKEWNISQSQTELYGRFQSIMKWIDQNQWIKDWVSQSFTKKFEEILTYLSDNIIFPPMRIDSQTGYPEENYYWKKFYHNRVNSSKSQQQDTQENKKDLDSNGQNSSQNIVLSPTQLLWFKIKMVVFARRITITEYCMVFCVVITVLTLFGLFHLCLLLIFSLIGLAFKYRLRPVISLCKFLGRYRGQNTANIVGRLLNNLFEKLKLQFGSITLKKCLQISKFTLFCLLRFMFGLSFIAYNIFVVHYYHLIMKGKIYGQQLILLSVLVLQILFRCIGQKIGSEKWILPGLSFKFVYWMFLPIYYFFFGSSILSFTKIIESKNFQLGFFLCLCMPLLVKLIEHEIQNGFKKITIKVQENHQWPQRLVSNFVSFLSHLSVWIERVILVLLIMVNLLPNLRYMRFSQGLIIQSLYESLIPLKYVGFVFLVCILAYKSLYLIYVFLNRVCDSVKLEIVVPQSFQKILETPSSTIGSQVIEGKLSSIEKTQQPKNVSFMDFVIETIGSYTIIERYVFRAYLMYVILFGKSHEYLFRHLSLISIQETYSDEEQMPAYLLGVLLMIFVNFAVEIYLEKEFDQLVREHAKILDFSEVDTQQGTRQSLSVQPDIEKDPLQKESHIFTIRNSLGFKKIDAFLAISQMGIFILPRLSAISQFYSYFHMIDEGKEFDKNQFQSDIFFSIGEMMCAVACGYMLLMPLMRRWVEGLSGKGYGAIANDDKSFESDENEETRQHDMNDE